LVLRINEYFNVDRYFCLHYSLAARQDASRWVLVGLRGVHISGKLSMIAAPGVSAVAVCVCLVYIDIPAVNWGICNNSCVKYILIYISTLIMLTIIDCIKGVLQSGLVWEGCEFHSNRAAIFSSTYRRLKMKVMCLGRFQYSRVRILT
jgi:hypothetical protein